MAGHQHTFEDGEVIVGTDQRHGAGRAYVVADGNVEISRPGDKGPLTLAVLGAGDRLDPTALERSGGAVLARAVGPVVLEELPGESLIGWLRSAPGAVLSRLGALLFGAPTPRPPAADPPVRAPDSVQRSPALSWGWGRDRIHIRVAPLAPGPGVDPAIAAAVTRQVVDALDQRRVSRARAIPEVVAGDPTRSPIEALATAAVRGRALLSAADADLLVWGEVPAPAATVHLRFVSLMPVEDRPGAPGPSSLLVLPTEFGRPFAPLLLATALSAVGPRSPHKAARVGTALPALLEAALPVAAALPVTMTPREQAATRICAGHALATLAHHRSDRGLHLMAAETYRDALAGLSDDELPLEQATAYKSLGAVLQILAEGDLGAATLEAAAEALTRSLAEMTRQDFPREWAAAQTRLGQVLYRLDARVGDVTLLKDAVNAFQRALQGLSREHTPLAWAEAMNGFAQATQVLGEQFRSRIALETAVAACRAALMVRHRETTPLAWAATQNNLGSALFLLGRLTGEAAPLDEAAAAFQQAHDVYLGHGAPVLAAIADRNASHVTRLLVARQGKTDWGSPEPRPRPRAAVAAASAGAA